MRSFAEVNFFSTSPYSTRVLAVAAMTGLKLLSLKTVSAVARRRVLSEKS